MRPIRDPEGAELEHLLAVCPPNHKRVLEIGCGDGAFTRQYDRRTRKTIGIDPANSEVHIARSKSRSRQVSFLVGQGEKLPFPGCYFDIVIFGSSL